MSITTDAAEVTAAPLGLDRRARLGLAALFVSAFALGSAEFVAIGLLPDVATDLKVSVGTASLMISAYAATVVVGGPLLVATSGRVPRKVLLVGLMIVFSIGNVVTATAASMPVLVLGRVLSALGQGAFFGVGSVAAAQLVPEAMRARAIAIMFGGVTVANVLGAPLGTFVGQALGWRAAVGMVGCLGVLGAATVLLLVPGDRSRGPSVRSELVALRTPLVWPVLAVGALTMTGLFAPLSFAATLTTDGAGLPASAVTPVMVGLGIGLTLGTWAGGRLADDSPWRTLLGAPAALALGLLAVAMTVHLPVALVVSLALAGAAGYAVIPAYLGRVISLAETAPTLAAAVAGSAGNLGITLGTWAGGWALDQGWGPSSPAWVGIPPVLAAVALAAILLLRARRHLGDDDRGEPAQMR